MRCCLAGLATFWPCRSPPGALHLEPPLGHCILSPPHQKGCCAPSQVCASRLLLALVQQPVRQPVSIWGDWGGCAQGWNVLGNLLDLGKVAFAPASPAVLRLVDNLLSTHELMAE